MRILIFAALGLMAQSFEVYDRDHVEKRQGKT